MNKKQLIVAWMILLFLTGCCHPKGSRQLTDGKGYVEAKFSIPF